MERKFFGEVKNGKLVLDRRDLFDKYTQFQFDGKKVVLTLEVRKSKRSGQQNAYMWSCVYRYISETTGYTENEVHEWARKTFLPPKIYSLGGKEVEVSKSTTELSVGEMADYITSLIQFAQDNLDCHIPSPEESGFIK